MLIRLTGFGMMELMSELPPAEDASGLHSESATADSIAEPHFDSNAYCLKCGYNLRGLTGRRCPECGSYFDPANGKTFRTEPFGNALMELLGLARRGLAGAAQRIPADEVAIDLAALRKASLAGQVDELRLENTFLRAYVELLAGILVAKGILSRTELDELTDKARDAVMAAEAKPEMDDTQVLEILNDEPVDPPPTPELEELGRAVTEMPDMQETNATGGENLA
jgi:hypothetical protein